MFLSLARSRVRLVPLRILNFRAVIARVCRRFVIARVCEAHVLIEEGNEPSAGVLLPASHQTRNRYD